MIIFYCLRSQLMWIFLNDYIYVKSLTILNNVTSFDIHINLYSFLFSIATFLHRLIDMELLVHDFVTEQHIPDKFCHLSWLTSSAYLLHNHFVRHYIYLSNQRKVYCRAFFWSMSSLHSAQSSSHYKSQFLLQSLCLQTSSAIAIRLCFSKLLSLL